MATKRGRPKTAATKNCSACGTAKAEKDFYFSYNALHGDGKMPICKECFKAACRDENGIFDFDKFLSLLRQFDRPFIQILWDNTENEVRKNAANIGEDIMDAVVGKYMKNLSLPQNRGKKWDDSDVSGAKSGKIESSRRKSNYAEKVYYLTDDSFEVTDDMIRLFGEGYTAKEYEIMNRIYENSRQDYPDLSSNQRTLLLRYVRFAAKEEIATSSGQIADAEKWSKMSTEALKQLNAIDTHNGMSSFSEFFQQFERAKDISRILPKFKYRPNDAPDFIIWCYINYCRRLEGKPEVEYADIYRFYDTRVEEYVKQYGDPYGIFTDDPRKQNREKIKEFITLPDDYKQEV